MLDPVLLESFLAVAQARNFSEAGRRLFVRDTHSVVPTPDGEAMEGFARSILEANERARRYFAGSQLRGRVRFGTSEDFVTSRLPESITSAPTSIRSVSAAPADARRSTAFTRATSSLGENGFVR